MDDYGDSEDDRLRRAAFTARVLARLRGTVAPPPRLSWKQQRAKVPQALPTEAVREQMIARGVILPSLSKTSESKAPYTLTDARSDRDRWLDNARRASGR